MRLASPPILTACAIAAATALAPAATAAPTLPPGADRPPVLPPGVVPAEAPVETGSVQTASPAGQPLALGPNGVGAAAAAPADNPWATVNICDTANLPNSLGVRASMPGTGHRQLMFMRFAAQYWSPSRDAWVDVPGDGRSRWVYAGSARFAAQQTGWTFTFEQPPSGTTFVMRAVVEQEWRGPEAPSSDSRAKRNGARRTAANRKAGRHRARGRRAGSHKTAAYEQQTKRKAHEHRLKASAAARRGRAADPRARYAIAKQRTLLTQTGLEGVDGGDPPGTSKAMCLIW